MSFNRVKMRDHCSLLNTGFGSSFFFEFLAHLVHLGFGGHDFSVGSLLLSLKFAFKSGNLLAKALQLLFRGLLTML